jgi:hypothetical protein
LSHVHQADSNTTVPIRTSPVATTTTAVRRRWTDVAKRWPTALAVGPWALTLGGNESASMVGGLGEALLTLPWPYVIGARLQRPRVAWPLLLAGMLAITALRMLDVIDPSSVFVAAALILLVWSASGGHMRKPGMLRVQALGLVGFGAIALIGLAVDPNLGRFVVAAGWLLHGVWDFLHLRLDKVLVPSYAEFCGVYDVLVAGELVLLV